MKCHNCQGTNFRTILQGELPIEQCVGCGVHMDPLPGQTIAGSIPPASPQFAAEEFEHAPMPSDINPLNTVYEPNVHEPNPKSINIWGQPLDQRFNKLVEVEVLPGYEPLFQILIEALEQAQRGKGAKCHANDEPFLEQEICAEARKCGTGAMVYQIRKKVREAKNCDDLGRAVEDLLGAINYTAVNVIVRREGVR